jgi:hypothetical protein
MHELMSEDSWIRSIDAQNHVAEGDRSVLPAQAPRPLRPLAQKEPALAAPLAEEGREQQTNEAPRPRPCELCQSNETQSTASEMTSVFISHISSIA